MHLTKIMTILDQIDGYLSPTEVELLYSLAKRCKGKGVIVEIGSYKGKSTISLASGSKAGNRVKIYAIDPFKHPKISGASDTLNEFKQNICLAGVSDMVTEMVLTSESAAKIFHEPVELIFIDGDHDYKNVKLDYGLWFPKVINGGIMAFHDSLGDGGPSIFVNQSIFKSKNFKKVNFKSSITFAEKTEHISFYNRLANNYMLFLKKMCDVVIGIHLPPYIKNIGKNLLDKIKN